MDTLLRAHSSRALIREQQVRDMERQVQEMSKQKADLEGLLRELEKERNTFQDQQLVLSRKVWLSERRLVKIKL